MRKTIVVLFCALVMCGQSSLFAQDNQKQQKKERPSEEQMMEFRTNKIADQLLLDDATKAKFTTLYTQYMKEMKECIKSDSKKKDVKNQDKNIGKNNKKKVFTDSDFDDMMMAKFAKNRKMNDIKESYYKKFRKILSPRQIMKMYSQERNAMPRKNMRKGGPKNMKNGKGMMNMRNGNNKNMNNN